MPFPRPRALLRPVTGEVDEQVGDQVLDRLHGPVVAVGLGDDGLDAGRLAARGVDADVVGQQLRQLVEAALVEDNPPAG